MNKALIGKGIAWLAFLCAVISFFWQTNLLAGVAIVLSVIGYFLKAEVNKMSLTATCMALVAILTGMVHY
jgi:small neutral amino acid transporter SnatA (MarC family)